MNHIPRETLGGRFDVWLTFQFPLCILFLDVVGG